MTQTGWENFQFEQKLTLEVKLLLTVLVPRVVKFTTQKSYDAKLKRKKKKSTIMFFLPVSRVHQYSDCDSGLKVPFKKTPLLVFWSLICIHYFLRNGKNKIFTVVRR